MEEYAARVLGLVESIPPGRVVAYGDIARHLGEGGARNVGTVMSRYGSGVPWWRVIRADGRPPQGHESIAIEHWRSEGTPMVRGLLEGGRADMKAARWQFARAREGVGGIHHLEIWVESLEPAAREWGWLLGELGYRLGDTWETGVAYESGPLYIVVESGPDVLAGRHDRLRAGMNHVAFHAGSRENVERICTAAPAHGWSLMFADRHPHAGGPQHYAGFLESGEGFEVELVAR